MAELSAAYQAILKEHRGQKLQRICSGVPYVGLAESLLSITSLGRPTRPVDEKYLREHGDHHRAYLYQFKKDGQVIFTARCVDGEVVEVRDDRNRKPTPSYRPSYSSSSKKGDDPYGAKDYIHPETFYEDHYEDFYDFYDAENYFDEHN